MVARFSLKNLELSSKSVHLPFFVNCKATQYTCNDSSMIELLASPEGKPVAPVQDWIKGRPLNLRSLEYKSSPFAFLARCCIFLPQAH